MNEIQILGLVATVLGIITAIFNLVAFVREKDRGHLKAGILTMVVLGMIVGIVAFPHFAPAQARRMAAVVPAPLAPWLKPWLAPDAPAAVSSAPATPSAPAAASTLQGTCQVEIRRNLLGGIDSVVAEFRFADLSNRGGRVLSYQMRLQATPGGAVEHFQAVLDAPVVVAAGGTARVEVPLNGPVREAWLARHKEKSRGQGEMKWQGLDGEGHKIEFASPLAD